MRRLLYLAIALIALLTLTLPSIALAQGEPDGTVINPSTDLGMWSLLVGSLLPALVAVVQRSAWSKRLRVMVGVAASAVAAGVTTYLTEGDAMWDQGMLHAFLLVAVSAFASYQSFWKPTGVAAAIEAKTNATPSQPPG